MDESHNIVLPYSWPKPTTLSGEPIKGTVVLNFPHIVLTFSYDFEIYIKFLNDAKLILINQVVIWYPGP